MNTYDKVAGMIAEMAGMEASEITPDTKFEDLGIDSLDMAEMVLNIENDLGVKVEMDASLTDVQSVVAKIDELLANK
jgi:acyl carrier protein 1